MQPGLVRLLPDTATFSSEGVFHLAGHSIRNLAEMYGTPLYVFVWTETYDFFIQRYHHVKILESLCGTPIFLILAFYPLIKYLVHNHEAFSGMTR
jgi:hypothetical protein